MIQVLLNLRNLDKRLQDMMDQHHKMKVKTKVTTWMIARMIWTIVKEKETLMKWLSSLVNKKWKKIFFRQLRKNWESKINLEEKTKSCKRVLSQWILISSNMTNSQMFKWMNTNIWTLLQMSIKWESTLKRHKIDTIKWLQNYKLNLTKSKLSVMKLSSNLKS